MEHKSLFDILWDEIKVHSKANSEPPDEIVLTKGQAKQLKKEAKNTKKIPVGFVGNELECFNSIPIRILE